MLASCVQASPAADEAPGYPSPAWFAAYNACAIVNKFPEPSKWLPFDTLVANHTAGMTKFDTSANIADILTTVHSVADLSGGVLDSRVIFAQMIEESGGNVYIAAGHGGKSYGVMQTNVTPANAIDCADAGRGNCSSARILGMFKEYFYGNGVKGSQLSTPGVGYCLEANHNDTAKALRCYNSGSVPFPSDVNSVTDEGRPDYVSNIGSCSWG